MQKFLSTINGVKKINKAKKMISNEEEKKIINNNEEDYEEEKLISIIEVIKQIKKIEDLQDDDITYYIENQEKIIKKYSQKKI